MIYGVDVSHWQNPDTFNYDGAGDFVVIKTSEGKTLGDNMAAKHYQNAVRRGKLIGFYHYAHPELNTPEEEAQFFLYSISEVCGQSCGYALLALDLEDKAFSIPDLDQWALKFCMYVKEKRGVLPLIYVQASKAHLFEKCARANIGCWLAWYNGEPETVSGKYKSAWTLTAMHQYTSTPHDKDVFFGNVDAWRAYAGYGTLEEGAGADSIEDAVKIADLLHELEELTNKYKLAIEMM